jgi:hypothetical protein
MSNTYNCGCDHDCDCDCEQPINCIQQAVNDALAGRIDELDGYADRAETGAENAEASATDAANSATQAGEYRDQSQVILNSAQALVPEINETSANLQETAEIVQQLVLNASSYQIVKYPYTVIGGESTITVPDTYAALTVQSIIAEGITLQAQTGDFTFDSTSRVITLTQAFDSEAAGTVITVQMGQSNAESPETVLTALASTSGAGLVGTSGGVSVQVALNNLNTNKVSKTELAASNGLTLIGRCSDVATLRTIEPTIAGQRIDVVAYYSGWTGTANPVGGGYYIYDAADTTTVDDGMLCIVTTGGKRWKPVLANNQMPASRAGLVTGVDATALWKKFCALTVDKILDGSIYVSGVAILADSTNLIGTGPSVVYITASVTDQVTVGNEGSCLEAGNKSQIRGIKFSGQNFNGAGIFIGSKTDVIIDSCEMFNSYAIGVKNYLSTGTKINKCHIHSNRHGVLSQQSDKTIVSNCHVHNISWTSGNNGGGIWTSSDTNMLITNNIVHDCADVGLDFEGGNNCISDGNIVARCRNGELTFFGTSTALTGMPTMGRNTHRNNTVFRESYAYNKDGVSVDNALTDAAGCTVYGTLDVTQDGELSFENNKVYSLSTTGVSLFCFRSRTSDPAATCKIAFRNNVFITKSGYMGTLLDRQDLTFEGNNLVFASGTVRTTELRDHRSMNFRNNTVDIKSGVTTGNNVFLVSTAIAATAGTLDIAKNKFTGYDGVWVYIDQINSGRSVTFDDNDFDDATGYTVIPMAIGTGGVIWKNQRIRLLRPTGTAINFAGIGVLYQSSFICFTAEAWIILAGKIKCGYRFALKCDKNDTMYLSAIDAGGAISTGRFPDATSFVTFTGNTLSFSTTGSSALSAVVTLHLDSIPV